MRAWLRRLLTRASPAADEHFHCCPRCETRTDNCTGWSCAAGNWLVAYCDDCLIVMMTEAITP